MPGTLCISLSFPHTSYCKRFSSLPAPMLPHAYWTSLLDSRSVEIIVSFRWYLSHSNTLSLPQLGVVPGSKIAVSMVPSNIICFISCSVSSFIKSAILSDGATGGLFGQPGGMGSCSWCHVTSGGGSLSFSTGCSTAYIESLLQNFQLLPALLCCCTQLV